MIANNLNMFEYVQLQYSQTMPTKDNHAANSLADDIQTRNIRKVAVNARINAVLWLLELVANFCILIVWVFIVGSSSPVGLTNSMLWYYMILPYTRLMNTAYNKDRIIDDGWNSVILNSVKSIFPCIRMRPIPVEEQNQESEGAPNDKKLFNKRKRLVVSSESKPTESNVKVISLEHHLEPLGPFPCTSDGKQETQEEYVVRNALCYQSSIDSEKDIFTRGTLKSPRLKTGENLLSNMWDNVKDEDAYIHYFQQLLELEDPEKKFLVNHYSNFQIAPFNKVTDKNETRKTKRSNTDGKGDRSSYKPLNNLKNRRFEEAPLNINFIVGLMERTQQRQKMLEGFLINCDDETSYEGYFQKLVSFEERLIKD